MTQTVWSGPWSAGEAGTYLAGAVIPIRLSAISAAGWPVVLSLWFLYEDGVFHCASRSHARIVALLDANPRCGFEVAGETPPYCGVRGQGLASLDRDSGKAVLARLADRYLGSEDTPFRRRLMQGAQDEVALTIRPTRMMSWDYRKRMT